MRFELNPRGQPDAELRRIGEALIRDAIEQVEDPTVPPDGAVHEARKNMKKLRGMLRLIRPAAPGLYKVRIPTKVTARSDDRDRVGNRGGAGGWSVDAAVTIGQVVPCSSA